MIKHKLRPQEVKPPVLKPGQHLLSRRVIEDPDDGWWAVECRILTIGESPCRCCINTLTCTRDMKWTPDPESGVCLDDEEYAQLRAILLKDQDGRA